MTAIMADEILTVERGERLLGRVERIAAGRLKKSEEAFNNGIKALKLIRDRNLWEFARDDDGVMLRDKRVPKFEEYIRIFCAQYGVGRSTTFAALNVVDTWTALGLPDGVLFDDVGIGRAKEMKGMGIKFDGRKKELQLPSSEVLDKLPPASTPLERVIKKVEEVLIAPSIPLTNEDVRDSFRFDTGAEEEVHLWQSGKKDIWYSYSDGDYQAMESIIIRREDWENLDPKFKEWLTGRLKIVEYRNGEEDKK